MTTALTGAALVLAQWDGDSDHMDWDNGWWIVMTIVMVLFWVAVIAGIVWLVVRLAHGGAGAVGARTRGRSGALEVLDRRLAEGQISVEEYEERRRVLTSGGETTS